MTFLESLLRFQYGSDDLEDAEETLAHDGTPQEYDFDPNGSGRYRQGSGENPYQHSPSAFYAEHKRYLKAGFTMKQEAETLGLTVDELRQKITISKAQQIDYERERCQALKAHGYSVEEIMKKTGLEQRTVYNRLSEKGTKSRRTRIEKITDQLREELKTKDYLDVGSGVELMFGASEETLKAAIRPLIEEGYAVLGIQVPQMTNPGKNTNLKVLVPEGTSKKDLYNNLDKIKSIEDYSGGEEAKNATKAGIVYPKSIDSSRVYIRYAEDGGKQRDGTIELRKGVEDISLGGDHYAQCRIAVDDKYYLKGVALYGSDSEFPEGYDVIFNTNKHKGTALADVLKPLKENKDNPFGATIKKNGGQRWYEDENGEKQLCLINKVNSEGDWEDWSKSLSSQFLSKQPLELINQQLDAAYDAKRDTFNEICALDNPTLKKVLIASFSEDCDAAAVELKAAAMPRQASRLLLPVPSLKDNEVFAPDYEDGTVVYLVRHPHAGTFEIPRLIVNNKNNEALEKIGLNATDAIGINSTVAEQLSGADFDGDTVVVIPEYGKKQVHNSAPRRELIDFDPKEEYPAYEGMTKVKEQKEWNKGEQMGKVSNLITDMHIMGADIETLIPVVKHSMVIIDAEKHNLDWKRSEQENNIPALMKEYQGTTRGRASTLISKAGGEKDVLETKQIYLSKSTIDPETGRLKYEGKETGRTYKDGNPVKEKITKMEEIERRGGDANELSSGTLVEQAYANYANKCIALANESRKVWLSIKENKANPEAAKAYADEVESLDRQLQLALKNAPKERQAQVIANAEYAAIAVENPEIKDKDHKSERKRLKAQLLTGARIQVGAEKQRVKFSQSEWEAVQAGAISPTKLTKLINNANIDEVKKLAMPKETTKVTDAIRMKIISYNMTNNLSYDEIAEIVGLSVSTVKNILKEAKETTN